MKVFAYADSSAPDGGEVVWRGIVSVLAKTRSQVAQAGGYYRQAIRRLIQGRTDQEQVDYLLDRLRHELAQGATDVVLLYQQQLPLALRVLGLCRRHRVKFVQQYAEMHLPDDYPHGMLAAHYLRERFHLAVIPLFADGHLVISRWLERAVARRGARQVFRVPALNNTEQSSMARSARAKRAEIVITYLGAGARRDCLAELLQATRQARSRGVNVKLRCFGLSGDCLSQLNEMSARLNLQELVDLHGYVDDATLQQFLGEADAFALLRSPDRSTEACFPTRLPEFLATRRPVILTDVGDVRLYFKDRVNAMLVKPGDAEGVANAIMAVASDRNLRMAVGRAGFESGAVDFDYQLHGSRLFEWLRTVTGGQEALA